MTNSTNHNDIVSRIERIQSAHPWMLEREARELLVCTYAALTNVCGFRGEALQEEMELITQRTMDASRELLETLLIFNANNPANAPEDD